MILYYEITYKYMLRMELLFLKCCKWRLGRSFHSISLTRYSKRTCTPTPYILLHGYYKLQGVLRTIHPLREMLFFAVCYKRYFFLSWLNYVLKYTWCNKKTCTEHSIRHMLQTKCYPYFMYTLHVINYMAYCTT